MIQPYPQILCLGDSLVQCAFNPGGWGSALVSDYSAKMDVVNRGFGG